MSRNKEKAQSSLNRFYQSQSSAPINYHYHQRPKNIHSITQLSQAEGWRRSIIGEISKQLMEINDFEISDIKVRELNDQLNELFNEKRRWEYHIRDKLHGNDYIRHNGNTKNDLINTGIRVNNLDKGKYYRYFGRAKDLPEMKLMIEENKKNRKNHKRDDIDDLDQSKRRRKVDQYKSTDNLIDMDYYGFYDEEEDEYLDDSEAQLGDPLVVYEEKRTKELNDEEIQQQDTENLEQIRMSFNDILTNEVVTKWLVNKRREQLLSKFR